MSLSPSQLAYQQQHINDNLQPAVIISTAICLSAAYIAVVLRFVSRKIGGVALGKDDYTILLALVVASVFSCLVIFLTTVGLGRHQITLSPSDAVTLAKTAMASECILNLAIISTKGSILLLYHRLFRSRTFTRTLWAVGIFVASWVIAGFIIDIFQCVPVRAVWDPTIPHTCLNFDAELIAVSVLNVFSDVLILCLPLPMLWKLQTSTPLKLQLIGIFMMGSLVCVGSIVRAVYSSEVSLTDASWLDTKPAMWSMIETNLAIVSACLPTYRPLARFLFNPTYKDRTADSGGSLPLGVLKSVQTTQKYGSKFSSNDDRDFVKLTSGTDVEISAGIRS